MNRTLRFRMLFFGLVGLASTLVSLGIGLAGNRTIARSHAQTIRLASLVRQAMLADMMHDAIRADALNAIHVAGTPGLDSVQADAREHIGIFRRALDTVGTLDDPAVRAQLAKTVPAVERYAQALEGIVRAARGGSRAAEVALPGFLDDFQWLEREMGVLDESVERAARQGETVTTAVIARSRWFALATGLFASVLLIGLAIWNTRSVNRPLAEVIRSLEALAQGDLTRRVGPAGIEEIDRMAKAFHVALENQTASLLALGEVARATGATATNLDELAKDMSLGADEIARRCAEAADSSRRLNQVMRGAHEAAGRSAAEIGGVAAAVEEMSATAGEIARGAEQSRQTTRRSVEAAIEAEG